MKKQAYYLPNLNSLLMQNHSYHLHQQKLKEAHSQQQVTHSEREAGEGELTRKEHLLVKLIPGKQATSRSVYDSCQADLLRMNRNYRLELTPLQKRKCSEQSRENICMYQAIQILSPRVDRYNKQSEDAQAALKERISKFSREGSKISYKFKKSLIEVEKRKKKTDDYYTHRSNALREEARAQLHSIIEKSICADDPLKPRRKSTERTRLQQIIDLVKAAPSPTNLNLNPKLSEHRFKTEESPPSQDYFLSKNRELINRKILAYHLDMLKAKQKHHHGGSNLLTKNMLPFQGNLQKQFNPTFSPKCKQATDMQIISISPVGQRQQ